MVPVAVTATRLPAMSLTFFTEEFGVATTIVLPGPAEAASATSLIPPLSCAALRLSARKNGV